MTNTHELAAERLNAAGQARLRAYVKLMDRLKEYSVHMSTLRAFDLDEYAKLRAETDAAETEWLAAYHALERVVEGS